LSSRTQQEIAQFQSERAQAFIEEAIVPLVAAQIPCRGFFKRGNIVFSILDTAEELDCHEIAMPVPKRFFCGGVTGNCRCGQAQASRCGDYLSAQRWRASGTPLS